MGVNDPCSRVRGLYLTLHSNDLAVFASLRDFIPILMYREHETTCSYHPYIDIHSHGHLNMDAAPPHVQIRTFYHTLWLLPSIQPTMNVMQSHPTLTYHMHASACGYHSYCTITTLQKLSWHEVATTSVWWRIPGTLHRLLQTLTIIYMAQSMRQVGML